MDLGGDWEACSQIAFNSVPYIPGLSLCTTSPTSILPPVVHRRIRYSYSYSDSYMQAPARPLTHTRLIVVSYCLQIILVSLLSLNHCCTSPATFVNVGVMSTSPFPPISCDLQISASYFLPMPYHSIPSQSLFVIHYEYGRVE